ncbi:hypothetical protein U1Q18_052099 [Sarracenia purpurea var. burkii]
MGSFSRHWHSAHDPNRSVQKPGSETSLFVLQMTSLSSVVQTSVLMVLLKLLGMAGGGAALEAIRLQHDGEVSLLGALVDLVEGAEAQEGSVPDDSQFHTTTGKDQRVDTCSIPAGDTCARTATADAGRQLPFLFWSKQENARKQMPPEELSLPVSTRTLSLEVHTSDHLCTSRKRRLLALWRVAIFWVLFIRILQRASRAEQTDLATMSTALAKASVEALLCSGVVLVIPSSSSTSSPPVTQDMLAASSLRLLDTVLRHSTSKTLAAMLAGTSAMLSIAGTQDSRTSEALRKCMHTIQMVAQPRTIPVPEWNLEVQDVSVVLGSKEHDKEMEMSLHVEDSSQSGWLRDAARDVLDLEFTEKKKRTAESKYSAFREGGERS